jgi:hypothetical protein
MSVSEKEVFPDSACWELAEVIFVPRVSGLDVFLETSETGLAHNDARHGNSILKNEQQVFTPDETQEKPEENVEKCWNTKGIGRMCRGETLGKK